MPESGIILKSIDATPEQQKQFWETQVAERLNGEAPDYHAKNNNCIHWINDLYKEAKEFLKAEK